MIQKSYTLASEDEIPIASFLDEFNIGPLDARKLRIRFEVDGSGVYYVGESPEYVVTIEVVD